MIARSVSLTEAKAKLSELLDLVERGEEIIIVRHGKRIARLRSYAADRGDPGPSLRERLQLLRDSGAPDREGMRRRGEQFDWPALKRQIREGLL
jgi:prevent-host-death family protein